MLGFTISLFLVTGDFGDCWRRLADFADSLRTLITTVEPQSLETPFVGEIRDRVGHYKSGRNLVNQPDFQMFLWETAAADLMQSPAQARALKLRPPEQWYRIRREYGVLRWLRDLSFVPRIFEQYHVGALDGISWPGLSIEWIEGEDLKTETERIGILKGTEEKKRRLQQILSDALTLSEMIDAVHARGFYLLDLKPSNMVRNASGLRLIDLETPRAWGLRPSDVGEPRRSGRSTRFFSDDADETDEPYVLGTPPFGAPELFVYLSRIDRLREIRHPHYYDYYSLGALIMYMAIENHCVSLKRRSMRLWHHLQSARYPQHFERRRIISEISVDFGHGMDTAFRELLTEITTPSETYPSPGAIREKIRGLRQRLGDDAN